MDIVSSLTVHNIDDETYLIVSSCGLSPRINYSSILFLALLAMQTSRLIQNKVSNIGISQEAVYMLGKILMGVCVLYLCCQLDYDLRSYDN